VIIQYKTNKFAYQKSLTGNAALPLACFKHDFGGESNTALPQSCFRHDRGMYLSDILSEKLSVLTKEV